MHNLFVVLCTGTETFHEAHLEKEKAPETMRQLVKVESLNVLE